MILQKFRANAALNNNPPGAAYPPKGPRKNYEGPAHCTLAALLKRSVPLTDEDIIVFADREGNWPMEYVPADPLAKGGLRAYVWNESRPDPQTHLEESFTRCPELGKCKDLEVYFLKNARAQNVPRKDPSLPSGRCNLCGSHYFGFDMNDHKVRGCPFNKLSPAQRLRFQAINNLAYCQHCHSRSPDHTKSRHCSPRKCENCGDFGHQMEQAICEENIGIDSTYWQEQQERYVKTSRVKSIERIQKAAITGQLKYATYLDSADTLICQRVRERADIAGWGPFFDDDKQFPRLAFYHYTNNRTSAPVHYPTLVPAEYDVNMILPTPQLTPPEAAYLMEVAKPVTTYRQT